jgi:hypothetical protein
MNSGLALLAAGAIGAILASASMERAATFNEGPPLRGITLDEPPDVEKRADRRAARTGRSRQASGRRRTRGDPRVHAEGRRHPKRAFAEGPPAAMPTQSGSVPSDEVSRREGRADGPTPELPTPPAHDKPPPRPDPQPAPPLPPEPVVAPPAPGSTELPSATAAPPSELEQDDGDIPDGDDAGGDE